MHLGILSWLILALAGNFLGGAHNTTGAAHQASIYNPAPLFSVAAQATTTTTTEITPTVLVTTTVEAAGTVTTTATTTGTVPAATAVPLPTVGPQSSLQINPFDWNFLTSAPALDDPNKIGPFAIVFLVLMLGLIAAGVYLLRFRRPQWKGTNPVLFKAVNRFAPYAIWIGIIGILFLLFRVISLDFLNQRFWLYLTFLAAIALAVWVLYWYRTSYPKEMAKFQKTQKARQYMPGAGGKVPARSTAVASSTPRTGQSKGSSKNRKRK
jgi:hypothetical protein